MYDEDERNTNYTNENIELLFTVEKCDPSKFNITCPTEEEYEKNINKASSLILKYMFTDNTIKPKNFSHPIRNYHLDFQDISFKKVVSMYKYHKFSLSEVRSDDGFIIDNVNKQFFLEHDKAEERVSKEQYKFTMKFLLSKRYHIFSRTYLKLQALLAQIKGFMYLIEYCVLFMYAYYKDNEYSVTMLKNLFNLEIKETPLDYLDHNVELDKVINKNNKVRSTSINENNSNLDSISVDNVLDTPLSSSNLDMSHKDVDNKNTLKKKKTKDKVFSEDNKVNIGSNERFIYGNCCFCCYSKNKENTLIRYGLMLKAESIIKKRSNIVELFKMMDEVDILKKLNLNENQEFLLLT